MSYKDQCKKLAELYKEAGINGQPFEYHSFPCGDPDVQVPSTVSKGWNNTNGSPTVESDLSKWRIKPKKMWIVRLFDGCPIVLDAIDNPLDKLIVNYIKNNFYTAPFRLPTIEESPRNVWLAPWDEKPEGFDNVRIMMRNKLNNTWDYEPEDKYEPENVTAIMIMENLNE